MSEVKVNKISPRSGTTVTLGDSGDTFTIPSGATINNQGTATNFGATGAASWTTTVKTSGFTAVAGEGYFVNTTGGAVSVNLPAGTAGAVVAFKDYLNTFDTNNLTLVQNGSDKIGGSTINATVSTEGISITLVFIDSTQGWLITDDGKQSEANTNPYMIATGGTITTSGNDKIHTFTGPGTFTVCTTATCAADNLVSYVVVAGGGGGGGSATGYYSAGGAGAGGFREVVSPSSPYTGSPLNGYPSSPNRITVTATAFPIVVGAGASGGTGNPACGSRSNGGDGGVSTFSTITSAGGGGGGKSGGGPGATAASGQNGGSGGGGGGYNTSPDGAKGEGNTPPTTPAQGQDGGTGYGPATARGGGGGGAGGAGTSGPTFPTHGAPGGAGVASEINASPITYAVGGQAGQDCNSMADNGTTNRGNGAQGGNNYGPDSGGGTGGSGIIIIRYRFQ
jgi:hypothetical protein